MSRRVITHIIFWFGFLMAYVMTKFLFAPEAVMSYPLAERFFRYFMGEIALFPWKIIPFYFLFYYLIPKYFKKGQYVKFGIFSLIVLFIALLGHRSMVAPVRYMVLGETTDFNVYSFSRMLYTLLDILPAIGLAASIKLLRGSIASQQKEQALEKEKLESELNFLKAQTNPHFLFNTLNNLYGLARRNDTNTAPSIMKLSNIMRYILYECNAPSVKIENEVEIIEDYIQLEKLRYNDRLKVTFNKELDDPESEIAPLILLPFVENAFKHGASETRFDTFIELDLSLSNRQLHFSLKNSRDQATEPKMKSGIGLKNVKRQLDLVYGNNYALEVRPEQKTYFIDLKIHLNHHEK